MKSPRHILPAALVTCAAALAVPSLASAADFCVNAPTGCTGSAVSSADFGSTLKAAESNGTDDRFFLGAGTYKNAPISYQSLEQVEIIGLSRDGTVLTSTDPGTVLTLGGNQDSRVSNLTITPAGQSQVGLALAGTKADRVDVKADPAAQAVTLGLTLSGGARFSNGTVSHNLSQWGADFHGSGGTIEDSVIETPEGIGIVGAGGEGKVLRSTVKAAFGSIIGTGHVQFSDTVIDTRVAKTPQVGVLASTSAGLGGTTATADLERVTILGSNQKPNDATAIGAEANGAGKTGSVTARDSIMTGFQNSILRQGNNEGLANVTTDRSVYLTSTDPGLDQGSGSLTETNRLTVSPRFVNPAANDFHLAADSPLIDAGSPGDLPADALDRDGKPRQSDGNGDCSRVSDIGAFEFQGTSVRALAHAAAASARAGQALEFSSDGSCIPGPGAPQVKWSFDDGASADGATVSHAFATAGKHTATATVSDADGHSAGASADVTITPAPVGPKKIAKPVVSNLRVAPLKVKIGSVLPKLVKKPTAGSSIQFTLSTKARVELRFKKGGKAIKTTVRVNAGKGSNRVRFAGRLSRAASLKPGSYKVTAIATDATGAHSKATSARFKVVK